MNKILLLFLSILFVSKFCYGQEQLSAIQVNAKVNKPNNVFAHIKTDTKPSVTLSLPFFDDFSSERITKSNWFKYNEIYFNDNFCDTAISLGVATFDALNENGEFVDTIASEGSFESDHLESNYIDLQGINPIDTVFLSFYYQPGGLGEAPDTNDSLILDFCTPKSGWKTVWFALGETSKPFKQVLIPITSDTFLQDSFQFRFRNYCSVYFTTNPAGKNSNGDIWNLDYVYLNKGRNEKDTMQNDLAIIKPLTSFLKYYESVPWKHFRSPAIYDPLWKGEATLVYRNNLKKFPSLYLNYTFLQRDTFLSDNYSKITVAEPSPIDLGEIGEFTENTFEPFLNEETDTGVFEIKGVINTDSSDIASSNDTVTYYQNFYSWYSYDDGSAEYGYGITGKGAENAKVAYRFRTYKTDSLQAINMFFNRTVFNENKKYINLTVWSNKNGMPDKVLYTKNDCPKTFNEFQTFSIDTPLIVSDTFYVGWEQVENAFLNVGWDVNRNKKEQILFYINGQWYPSSKNGCLLIRPILGERKDAGLAVITPKVISVKLYPNPARDYINLQYSNSNTESIKDCSVYDISGKLMLRETGEVNQLNIANLQTGMYFIKVVGSGKVIYQGKFIKTR
jgi:hypothetical protein